MKTCTECKETKALSDFYIVKGKARSKCKVCLGELTLQWRHKTGRSKTKLGEPRIDLTGKKFAKLLVLENKGITKGHRYWLCQCDCGNKKEVCHSHLTSGNQKSCGCLQYRKGKDHPLWSGYGDISGNKWDQIKRVRRSKRPSHVDRVFDITIEFAWKLFLKQNRMCALSGLPLHFDNPPTASLDRIDSEKGYIETNVQWVHKDINRMKNVFTQEWFIEVCKLVAQHER